MNLFLDLEETLIDDWFIGNLLFNKIEFIVESIKKIEIEYEKKFDNITIFSFAITNNNDKNHFNIHFKTIIENTFNLKIKNIFISNNKNLFELAKHVKKTVLEDDLPSDVFNGNLKQESFEAYCLKFHKEEISVLFDDVVENTNKKIFDNIPFSRKLKYTEILTIKV